MRMRPSSDDAERERLRYDIAVLEALVDESGSGDFAVLSACVQMLLERREQLAQLDGSNVVRLRPSPRRALAP